MCGIKCTSTKEINAHNKNTHENIQCNKCTKEFSNPYSLKKHMYEHGERKFKCEVCDMMFAFRSQLSDHSTTHAKDTRYWCQRAGCSSHFGRARDLKAHLEMHDTEPMKYPHCAYTSKDKRNIHQHIRVHDENVKPYSCKKCGERFHFTMQKKRHTCAD